MSIGLLVNEVSGAGNNVANKTYTLPRNVTAGSLILIVGAIWGSADPSPIVVTDTRSTPYTVIESTGISWSGGTGRAYIAYGIVPTSGSCVITVDPAGSCYINGYAREVFGASSTPFLNSGTEGTGTGTGPTADITTAVANALVVSVEANGGNGGGPTITPTAPSVQVYEDESGDQHPFSFVCQIAAAATTYTFAWTLGASRDWRVITAAFATMEEGEGDGGGGMMRPVPQSGGLV